MAAKLSISSVPLPPELILEIFSRLPTKSLQCLKSILDDDLATYLETSTFQHKHAFNVLNRPTNERLLFQEVTNVIKEVSPYLIKSLPSDQTPCINQTHNLKRLFKDIGLYDCRVIGASNGLICLYLRINSIVRKPNRRRRYRTMQKYEKSGHLVLLWNPCTGEHHVIPKPQGFIIRLFHGFDAKLTMCGFGYDAAKKTYKIVMAEDSVTQIYDLSTGLWKIIETIDISWSRINLNSHSRNLQEFGEYLNGALHWIESSTSIISIDLSTEVSTRLNLPQCCSSPNEHHLNLGVLKGCLSVSCYRRNMDKELNIWVMKVYGRRESWTNTLSVTVDLLELYPYIGGFDRHESMKPPLWASQEDETMFLIDNTLACWCPKSHKLCYYKDLNFFGVVRGILHVDTLVSPKPEFYGFGNDGDNNNDSLPR